MAKIATTVYEQIRTAILTGELSNSERLVEEDLAVSMGISRTPVREALRRLAAEGLVDVSPNRGARVAEWDVHDLREIFDLRSILESHACELATPRASAAEIEFLENVCSEMEELAQTELSSETRLPALAARNRIFHGKIIEMSNSTRLGLLIETLIHVPIVMQTYKVYSPEALQRSLHHHREIVNAMKAGDEVWASSVMRAHVLAAREEILGQPDPE